MYKRQVTKAAKVIDSLLKLVNRGESLSEQNVRYCMSLVNDGSCLLYTSEALFMLKDGERLEPLGGGVRVIVSNEHRFTTDRCV